MDENGEKQRPEEVNEKTDTEMGETMSSAVSNLVREAMTESENVLTDNNRVFTIEVEEELPPNRKPLAQGVTRAAAGGVKTTAGAATAFSKRIAESAAYRGVTAAGAAIGMMQAALDFMLEENVAERTAKFLEEAEGEGRRFKDNLASFLESIAAR